MDWGWNIGQNVVGLLEDSHIETLIVTKPMRDTWDISMTCRSKTDGRLLELSVQVTSTEADFMESWLSRLLGSNTSGLQLKSFIFPESAETPPTLSGSLVVSDFDINTCRPTCGPV